MNACEIFISAEVRTSSLVGAGLSGLKTLSSDTLMTLDRGTRPGDVVRLLQTEKP